MELVEEMERAGRFFNFAIFSSAEAITAFGMDNLVRLGAFWLWLGVESRHEVYAKNRASTCTPWWADCKIAASAVLASAILFLEDHTPETIEQDIDYVLSLRPSFTPVSCNSFPCRSPLVHGSQENKGLNRLLHSLRRVAWPKANCVAPSALHLRADGMVVAARLPARVRRNSAPE